MDKLFLINSNCKVDDMEENRKTRTIGTNTENNYTHTICPCRQQCYQHQMYYVPCCVPHFNGCSASSYMPMPYPRDINEYRCVCRKSCCGDYTLKCQCIHAFQQCSKRNECKLKTDMIDNNKTVGIDKSQEMPLLFKPSVSNIVDCTTQAKIAKSNESIETCLNYEHENKKNQDNVVLYDMHQYANKLLMKINEKDDKKAKKNYVEERKLLEDLLTPTNQFSISKSSMDSEEDSDECIEVDNNEEFELDKFLQNTSTKLITKGETEIIQHKSIECQRTKTISTKNEATNTSKNKFTDVAMLMMIKTLMEDQNKGSKNSRLNKILNHIDHLQPEECRRLVAALHFSSYKKPNSLDSAEAKISEDISCLSLLLHWNSAKGEGLGQTHEQLFERLAQIGRYDLSEWLGKTVFHELGQDFKKSLDNPFDELINEITESEFSTTTQQSLSTVEDDWLPFDTICWVIILLLIVIAIVVILQCLLNRSNKQRKRNKNRMSGIDNYIQYQPVLLEPES